MKPTTEPLIPHSFEARLSRLRLWTILPVVFLPQLVLSLLARDSLDAVVYRCVHELLLYGIAFGWWLVQVAPRPHSARTSLGPPVNLAGWRAVAVALFGVTCLQIMWWLGGSWGSIWESFSTGGYYSFNLANEGHTNPWIVVIAIALAPAVEELVFRGSLFRKWRLQWGPSKAALLTSVLFGALHPQPVTSFIWGLTSALLYTRTRTLSAAIVMHSLNNGAMYGLNLLRYLTDTPRLRLERPWEYAAFVLVLLVGVGLWAQFVRNSWRTLGDPLPPDSLNAKPDHAPLGAPEPMRVGS